MRRVEFDIAFGFAFLVPAGMTQAVFPKSPLLPSRSSGFSEYVLTCRGSFGIRNNVPH